MASFYFKIKRIHKPEWEKWCSDGPEQLILVVHTVIGTLESVSLSHAWRLRLRWHFQFSGFPSTYVTMFCITTPEPCSFSVIWCWWEAGWYTRLSITSSQMAGSEPAYLGCGYVPLPPTGSLPKVHSPSSTLSSHNCWDFRKMKFSRSRDTKYHIFISKTSTD